MAIDKQNTKELLEHFNSVFDVVISSVPSSSQQTSDSIKKLILGPALEEINEFIIKGRAPKVYLFGRSGSGKSSLINALANKREAVVGDGVQSVTKKAQAYRIKFEETFSEWEIIDSRGIFETIPAVDIPDEEVSTFRKWFGGFSSEENLHKNAVEQIKKDIEYYDPDVLLHVVTASEYRSLATDFRVIQDLKKSISSLPPTIIVLNRADGLDDPIDWPPEQSFNKAKFIANLLKEMADKVLKVQSESIDPISHFKGIKITNSGYLGIVPVVARENRFWNIETLSIFIGNHLPKEAQLDFYQAQKRKGLLKNLSSQVIQRFSAVSATAGAIPIPGIDFAILIPLEILMIGVIGGLSCRSFSPATVTEYMVAMGIEGGVQGLRYFLKQLVAEGIKFSPVPLPPPVGLAIHGTLASTTTFAIGKSAEKYFFTGEKIQPSAIVEQESEKSKSTDKPNPELDKKRWREYLTPWK